MLILLGTCAVPLGSVQSSAGALQVSALSRVASCLFSAGLFSSGSVAFRVSVWAELGSSVWNAGVLPPSLSPLSSLSAVTNKHHFADGPLLYQFRMNFRRRRRLIELLHERGRGIPESHDSPFCLRKQSSDGGNTSFLSGRRALCETFRQFSEDIISNILTVFIFSPHVLTMAGALADFCHRDNGGYD